MFRRDLSARKQRRSANLQRRRRLVTESLEDRRLLFAPPAGGEAANVFAVSSGNIASAGATEVKVLDTSPYTLGTFNFAVLGFHVEAAGAATLDPAAVQLSGVVIQEVLTVSDVGGGNDSLVLARVGSGNLNVTIGGDVSTTGDYSIEVFLAGDQNGDRTVSAVDDLASIFGVLGATGNEESDADLNGIITGYDFGQARANNGVTVVEPSANAAPMITSDGAGATAAVNVPENTTAVTDVQTSDDTDTEGSGLTYSKSGGVDAAKFNLDTSTGVLTFVTAPDFEVPGDFDADNDYIVIVTVTDSGGKFDSQELTVTVTNVNDVPPVITSDGGGATAAINVAENTTAVTDVQSSDPEGETENGGGLVYSLSTTGGGGTDNSFFTLNTATGVLTFTAAPDFETKADANADNDYEVQVTVTDTGALTDFQDITVTVTDVVEVTPPDAKDDTFASLGNVGIDWSGVAGALFADNGGGADDDGGGTLTVSAVQGVGANVGFATVTANGSVTANANGSFTYTPNAGFTGGADTFTYEIDNGGGTDTATVTINVSDMIWFLDDSAGPGGNGTLANPFDQISDLTGVDPDDVNQTIFMYSGNYSGPFTLENGQELVGEGATVSLAVAAGITVPTNSVALPATGGTRPAITSSANGIDLASGNTIRGLNIGNTTGTGITGTSVGTSTLSEVSISGTGAGVNITTGALAFTFDSLSSSNAAGITLSGVSGDFDVSSGTINSGTSTAVSIAGSPIDLGVTLTSVSSSGSVNGININNTTGTFEITGDGNTTTQGGNDTGGVITTSGSADGIVLTSTQGITLRNMTIGHTAATPADAPDAVSHIGDDGIHATTVTDLALHNVTIARTETHGVNGISVTNFTFDNSLLLNAGDGDEEHGLHFDELRGDNFVTDSLFDAFNETGIEVINASGTVDLTITDTTFQDNQLSVGNFGEEAILLIAQGTAEIIAKVNGTGSTGGTPGNTTTAIFDDIESQAIQAISEGTSSSIHLTVDNIRSLEHDSGDAIILFNPDNAGSGNLTVKNSYFTDDTFGPFAIIAKNDSSGSLDVTIQGNETSNLQLLNLNHDDVGSGSANGTTRALIGGSGANEGNVVDVGSNPSIGIDIIATETGPVGTAPDFSLTLRSNSITLPGSFCFCATAYRVDIQNDTRANVNIVGNSNTGDEGLGGFELKQLDSSVVGIQGFGGGNATAAATYVDGLNTFDSEPSFFTGNFVGGTPTLPTATTQPSPLSAVTVGAGGVAGLDADALAPIVAEAIARLTATGLTAEQVATLESTDVSIRNLPSTMLGLTNSRGDVIIDLDAAGWGWFIDSTPGDDVEFGADLVADDGAAAGRMDLLTVVMHELAHVLGADHDDDLMAGTLNDSTRRLVDVDEFFAELS